MVRPFPYLVTNHHFQSIPSFVLAIGIFISIFALVALCAKGGIQSRKSSSGYSNHLSDQQVATTLTKTPPRSPLANPKKLLSNFSNNIKTYNTNKNQENDVMGVDHENEGFGEGGLWQKNILMGEKCQPLEFSGAIYYDSYGNLTNQPPKSPRASIAASLQGSLSFPVSSRSSSDLN